MGAPAFALPTLEALNDGPHDVVAAYTQPDRPAGRGRRVTESPVKRRARELGIETRTPTSLKDSEAVAALAALRADAGVVVAYGRFLPGAVLDLFPKGALNLHPSLLPRWRGASPIPAAILAGDAMTGVTVMLVDEGMDSGPVLSQETESIRGEDTGETLSERLAVRGAALMAATLQRWLDGGIEPTAQDEAAVTFTKRLSREDGRIDWGDGADEIARQVRAYRPWPGSFTFWRGARVEIVEASPAEGAGGPPGTVHGSVERPIVIETGRGGLAVTALKPEGKRAMTAAEFAAGRRDFAGSVVPS